MRMTVDSLKEAMMLLNSGILTLDEIKGLDAKACPGVKPEDYVIPVLTNADLVRYREAMLRMESKHKGSVALSAHACDQMCPECPWRERPSSAPWTNGKYAQLEHHVQNLGGFACHMIDGDDRSFHQSKRTEHPCMGWKKAGGNVDAIHRRWNPDKPRFLLNAITSVRILEREQREEIIAQGEALLQRAGEVQPAEFIPPLTFTCPRCRRVSHNKNDVLHRYCGACCLYFK